MYKRFVVVDVFLGTYVDVYRRAVQAGWADHVDGRSTWPSPPHCRFGFYSTPRCVVSGRDYSALSQRRRSLQKIHIRSFIVHYSITITVEIWTGCIVVVSLMLCSENTNNCSPRPSSCCTQPQLAFQLAVKSFIIRAKLRHTHPHPHSSRADTGKTYLNTHAHEHMHRHTHAHTYTDCPH